MPRKRKTIPWLKIRDGVYYVYWYDAPTGRTKRLSLGVSEDGEDTFATAKGAEASETAEAEKAPKGKTAAETAQLRYAAFLSGGHEIFGSGRHDSRLTVSAALDQYRLEHVADKVVDKTKAEGVILLLKTWFGNEAFEDVDIPACRAYAAARMTGKLVSPARRRGGKAVSSSTCRRELGILQAAANHAARWKRMGPKAKPPTSMPSIELPAGGDPRLVFLTKAELALAVEAALGNPRLQDFMQVLYFTAARRRSVERLRRGQVDLRAGTINLTSPDETENERRSKKRRPTIPLHPKIRPIVERWLMAAEASGSEWLWGDDQDMFDTFQAHMKAVGLPDKAFPHVMRHSRATHLLTDGVPIYHVAKLLGDTIATVERVYGHLIPDDLGAKLEEYGT